MPNRGLPVSTARADDGGEFAQHIVKTEKLRGPVTGNEPGVERAAQRLDAALHQSHRCG